MTGAEGFDYMQKYWANARRDWTPAQRVWIIACWEALTFREKDKPAWFILPGGQSEPNNLDMIQSGSGADVLEFAKTGDWL